ncbi:HAD-IIA family hydrolase [Pseudodonghicola flavimaris]|uniref:HAD-IA family hydrolase n=1 Tax=Pseudodonghicola flavimaris TaxID=3050036 RepID=A0ABT7F3Q0_9RHOB|nr:HAD-IA family hydrolase [Pseudodonghicola flavimaris]MDK3019215.1 HAD-IA family hydrolase [Pseudodonghicola flavimaris]
MRLDDYDAILCDLDGCLISGNVVLPGARALLRRAGVRLTILSNNSTDTPETLSARLAEMGLEVPPGRIVLAGTAAIDHLAARPGARVRLFASPALRVYAAAAGLVEERGAPTHVLLAKDLSYGYAELQETIALLSRGARLVVANPDVSYPGPDGLPVPETGSCLAAILSVLPGLDHDVVGKPEPGLYRSALARYPVATRVLAIGDNPRTDAAGARRLGLDFALVGAEAARWRSVADFLAASDALAEGPAGAVRRG